MILASQSPRRRQLLEEAGFSLEIRPADIDEAARPDERPAELVRRLASEKAEACRQMLSQGPADGLLVAADTIVWSPELGVLGKPADPDDARRTLAALSGRTHHVSTGVSALLLSPTCEVLGSASFVETTDVTFYELTEAEIDAYVATGDPMDKAGSYGIQTPAGRLLVKSIHGDYDNVVGLPIPRLMRELSHLTRHSNGILWPLQNLSTTN